MFQNSRESPRFKVGLSGMEMTPREFIEYVVEEWKVRNHSRLAKPKTIGEAVQYLVITAKKNVYFSCKAFGSGSKAWRGVDRNGDFTAIRR